MSLQTTICHLAIFELAIANVQLAVETLRVSGHKALIMLPPGGLAALGLFLGGHAPIEFHNRARIGEHIGVEDQLAIVEVVGLRGPVGC